MIVYDDDIHLGCSGWSYRKWIGKFYPDGSQMNKLLAMYSKTFDCVEVDSTFYGTPTVDTLLSWYETTVKNFKFCPKLDRSITHVNLLTNIDDKLSLFTSRIKMLSDKLGPVLIQLPPCLKSDPVLLQDFIEILPRHIEFAFEFRDNSWLNDRTESILQSYNIATAWSDSPFTRKLFWDTGNFIYLRLVGDRSIPEDSFGTVQRMKDGDITGWAEIIRKSEGKAAYIFANNHYEGFSPHTVDLFKEELGINRSAWPIYHTDDRKDRQTTLF
ncbi:MAG: hypothetical protein B2I18_02280 [Cuniculiplasma sp. C_DKE]|jgi:uncharacterized protein YecE (DUF72 family)|nr:MAG: hypothetical protein B2I18_02280 [Cuniculiplasma sp. C_DKE]